MRASWCITDRRRWTFHVEQLPPRPTATFHVEQRWRLTTQKDANSLVTSLVQEAGRIQQRCGPPLLVVDRWLTDHQPPTVGQQQSRPTSRDRRSSKAPSSHCFEVTRRRSGHRAHIPRNDRDAVTDIEGSDCARQQVGSCPSPFYQRHVNFGPTNCDDQAR